jgi:hypothetical protein
MIRRKPPVVADCQHCCRTLAHIVSLWSSDGPEKYGAGRSGRGLGDGREGRCDGLTTGGRTVCDGRLAMAIPTSRPSPVIIPIVHQLLLPGATLWHSVGVAEGGPGWPEPPHIALPIVRHGDRPDSHRGVNCIVEMTLIAHGVADDARREPEPVVEIGPDPHSMGSTMCFRVGRRGSVPDGDRDGRYGRGQALAAPVSRIVHHDDPPIGCRRQNRFP